MDSLIDKIKSIQNKQKTLGWGSAESGDGEIMIVVGSSAYPKQTRYFVVDAENEVFLINDKHGKELYRKCENESAVVACVIKLLKEWFPPKGI